VGTTIELILSTLWQVSGKYCHSYGASADYHMITWAAWAGALSGVKSPRLKGSLPYLLPSEASPIYWVVIWNVIDIATCSMVGEGFHFLSRKEAKK
jgi:hypothetical protein